MLVFVLTCDFAKAGPSKMDKGHRQPYPPWTPTHGYAAIPENECYAQGQAVQNCAMPALANGSTTPMYAAHVATHMPQNDYYPSGTSAAACYPAYMQQQAATSLPPTVGDVTSRAIDITAKASELAQAAMQAATRSQMDSSQVNGQFCSTWARIDQVRLLHLSSLC